MRNSPSTSVQCAKFEADQDGKEQSFYAFSENATLGCERFRIGRQTRLHPLPIPTSLITRPYLASCSRVASSSSGELPRTAKPRSSSLRRTAASAIAFHVRLAGRNPWLEDCAFAPGLAIGQRGKMRPRSFAAFASGHLPLPVGFDDQPRPARPRTR